MTLQSATPGPFNTVKVINTDIAEKGESENNLQFGKRIIKELVRTVVKLSEMADDKERYQADVQAIDSPAIDVPDDIVQ